MPPSTILPIDMQDAKFIISFQMGNHQNVNNYYNQEKWRQHNLIFQQG
jgi:hypothetical protein